MTQRSDGWSRLTADVEEYGESWVLDSVVTRIAEGENPQAIAVGRGYTWYVLRKWMEDKAELMQAWELAKRCCADGLLYEGLRVAKDAVTEDVQVAKLQVETYGKVAGKMNRSEWGEKVQVEVTQTVSIVDALREARGRVIEQEIERLPAVVPVTHDMEERVL